MKNTIQINKKWWAIWPTLTRNQILLSIILLMKENEEYYIQYVYGKFKDINSIRGQAFSNDYDVIKELLVNTFNFNELHKGISNEDIIKYGGYNTVKITSLNKIFQHRLSKEELLIFLWLIDVYADKRKINKERYFKYKISDILKTIFAHYNNPRLKRKLFIETLYSFKTWTYENNDVFIKDYSINGHNLELWLDPKTRDYIPKKYRKYNKKYTKKLKEC